MNIPYTFHPGLMARIPRHPFGPGMESFNLDHLTRDPAFMEAIFLASPVLHAELLKYQQGKIIDEKAITDLSFSLGKYYLRMRSRCTPLGLFSRCSVARWSNEPGALVVEDKPGRHTRLDMHYLCALAQHLATLPFL